MNKKELEAFAKEAAKGIKTQKDLAEFSQTRVLPRFYGRFKNGCGLTLFSGHS